MSLVLPLGFTLGASIQAQRLCYDGAGQPRLTLDGRLRRDRVRSFSVFVLNRAFTTLGFSPRLALIHDTRPDYLPGFLSKPAHGIVSIRDPEHDRTGGQQELLLGKVGQGVPNDAGEVGPRRSVVYAQHLRDACRFGHHQVSLVDAGNVRLKLAEG